MATWCCAFVTSPASYRYVPGRLAVNVYGLSVPGAAPARSGMTPSWPWNRSEVVSPSSLCRVIVTVSPAVTQSVGPPGWVTGVFVVL